MAVPWLKCAPASSGEKKYYPEYESVVQLCRSHKIGFGEMYHMVLEASIKPAIMRRRMETNNRQEKKRKSEKTVETDYRGNSRSGIFRWGRQQPFIENGL